MEDNKFIVIPYMALRGLNIYPRQVVTFDVEREASVSALDRAMKLDRTIFLTAQKDISIDIPMSDDLYRIGTVCRIRQILRQPRSSICKVMVEGLSRAEALSFSQENGQYVAEILRLKDETDRMSDIRKTALIRSCLVLFDEYLRLNPEQLSERLLNVMVNPDFEYVAYYIAQTVNFTTEDKQKVLEAGCVGKRLTLLNKLLANEVKIINIEKELSDATQEAMNKAQREYFLREEMKVIQSELGDDSDDVEDYRLKVSCLQAPQEVKDKLNKEISRLSKQPFGSAEASVIRSYIDVCLEMPWGRKTEETLDISKARKMLDNDHYGLEKVKERIIEYLAVKKLTPDVKGGLICLVGPPGTGKTSIAMSIAKATNRKLVRISLGGVHDEAEIRGHRKTYIGAMPGRIINGIIQAGSCNPLMVLDEIDKLGSDYRGDPSAALLEALDPEQNSTFRDNFLELPFDLSGVFFITTANSTDTIPRALLDRMEVIELTSYTDEEKLQIAKDHLIPKQRKKHGLTGRELRISDEAVRAVIASYTKESGVRLLERAIAKLCRKSACKIAEGAKSVSVKPSDLAELLGPERYKKDEARKLDEVGLVRGLAWTAVGGEVLDVEAAVVEGTGKLELTGNLGDVMKESAKAAVTYIRSRADILGIPNDFYKTKDIHIHFPEGAVPKDGPSAGITITVALISALTGTPVRHDVAMTGEISLRGRVMAIGGLKEKTMAAKRAGVTTVIIPSENVPDLEEIDQTVRASLRFVPVTSIDEVVDIAIPMKTVEKQTSVIQPKHLNELCSVVQ